MATIKVKRSAVAGRVPATTDLELGEIAINTYDGVAYIKKSVSGTDSVVQIGSANLSQNLQNRYQYTATAAQTTFSAVYLAPYVDVYLNGIRLIAGVDYTATNGTTVVLTTAASLNNTVDIVAYTSYTANANFADLISSHVTTALGYTPENPANKGAVNGYASLNSSGQVPSAQLPSFVDDVVEYANLAALPATGETGKIYVTTGTNKTYRWSGSAYVEIASSPGSTDAVTEGSSNLYFTNARARNALSATQNLSYSSSTGVFTGPDLSGYLTSGTAASVYAPLANPTFSGSVTNNGTTTLAGNVGIGTTPTTQRLKLGFDTTGRNGINITNFNISAGPAYIAFQGYDWVQSAIWHDRASGAALQFAVNPNTTDLSVNGCAVAATFLNNGNFGIGTNNPGAKLEIGSWSSGQGLKINYGNASGSVEAINFIGNGGANGVIGMQMVSAGVGDLWLGGAAGRSLTLYRDGNVGIGTNTPGRKLHVVGGAIKCGDNAGGARWSTDSWSRHIEIDSTNYGGGGIVWLKQDTNPSRAILANNGNFYIARSTADDNSAAPTYDFTILASGAIGFGGANYGTTGQVLTSQGSGSAPIWSSASGGSSQWTTTGSNIYYTTGDVGIGTNSPSATGKLSVVQSTDPGTTPAALSIVVSGVGGGTATNQYGLRVTANGYNNATNMYGVYSYTPTQYTATPYAGYFATDGGTKGYGVYASSANNNLASGNNSYGVFGLCTAAESSTATGASYGGYFTNTGTSTSESAIVGLYAHSTNGAPFIAKAGSSEAMRISKTGNVGIGTDNPTTSKLQINLSNGNPVTSGISVTSGAGVYPGTDNFVAGKFVSNHFGTSWGVWGESTQGGYGNCWGVYGKGGVVGGFSAGVHGLGQQQNTGGYGTACGGFFDAYATNQGPNGVMVGVYAKCTSVTTSGCGQSSYAMRLETNLGPVSSYGALYVHNGSQVFTLNSNGGISNFSGNNVNLSDEREKKNIVVAGDYLSKICAITVKTFNYNNDAEGEQVTLGVIAQEVEAVAPELVSESEWEYGSETNADGAPIALKRTRKGIYEADMMFAIMKSVQELNTKHEALKAEFDAYKASHP